MKNPTIEVTPAMVSQFLLVINVTNDLADLAVRFSEQEITFESFEHQNGLLTRSLNIIPQTATNQVIEQMQSVGIIL